MLFLNFEFLFFMKDLSDVFKKYYSSDIDGRL